nr:MAG TPA: hypothetical protein [Caudoviricetes sp.]
MFQQEAKKILHSIKNFTSVAKYLEYLPTNLW